MGAAALSSRDALSSSKKGVEALPGPPLGSANVANVKRDLGTSWATVFTVSGTISCIALTALVVLPELVQNDVRCARQFYQQVPRLLFYAFSAAFASSFCQNLLSLFYEAAPIKKQLALLQCIIKGVSTLVELSLGLGESPVISDSSGAELLPIRYIQWSLTCPLIIWLCAWISDASKLRVAAAVGSSACTPIIGLVAALTPSPFKWIIWTCACGTHLNVVLSLNAMIKSAESECIDQESKRGLRWIRYFTHVAWNIFPVIDFCQRANLLNRFTTELVCACANYAAKVIFSSSVMYANFLTLAQRRALAKEAEEHQARIKMVADLTKAVEAKEEFMSVVSHELRTPLNGIIGLSEAMLGSGSWQLGETGTKYMKTIKVSSTHLASLINDILDAAAASKGKLAIKMEKANLDKLVAEVIDSSSQLVKPHVSLEKKVDPVTPTITADKKRLTQILYNLIGNALKFTHKGSVTVEVKPDIYGKQVLIMVRDTGCGIPPDQHDRIFDAFNQGDSSTTRKYGGTGLGLNIVSRLVEAHHGTISIESAVGKGSTFTIRLPVHQPDESLCPSAVDSNRASMDVKRSGQRVQMSVDTRSYPAEHVQESRIQDGPRSPLKAQPSYDVSDTEIAAAASLLAAPEQQRKGGIDRAGSNRTFSRKTTMAKPPLPGEPCSLSQGTASIGDLKLTHSEVHGSVLILSVDDEPTNHMVIAEMIRAQGYQMHEELDARLALDWIAAQPELPDLILLDCMMPHMSGHEFCKELRKTVPDSLVPVIMLSAKNSEDNIVKGLQQGCNDFCSKPVKRAELIARIAAHLRVKADATWVNSLVNGAMQDDAEAMSILKSILPEPIILRIQEGQRIIGDSHPHVVMLFSDIVGFSSLAVTLPPVEVFLLLTNLYTAFDRLVDNFDVYKVETIGDGYLVAAGHDENEKTAKSGRPIERMLKMAEAMLDVVKKFKMPNQSVLRVRIGINCGPAFAGVIGSKCPRYCFLGDTVNTASRMESTGFPMCIQASAAVVEDANMPDSFVSLGERSIKGKGIMTTHLFKAGEWQATRDSYVSSQRISGDQTPTLSLEVRTQQSVVGGTIDRGFQGGSSVVSSKLAVITLQEQLLELQHKLEDEKLVHSKDREEIAALSNQLQQAKNGISGSVLEAHEAAGKLHKQLQDAQHALAEEKTMHSADRHRLEDLQAQLSRAEQAAQHVVNQAALAAPVSNITLPLVQQGGLGSAMRILMPGPTHLQGNLPQPVVASAGYSIPQLLQSIHLEGYAMMFESQNIRLEALLSMGHEDLEALGIRSFGHRKAILQAFSSYVQMYLHSCDLAAQHAGL